MLADIKHYAKERSKKSNNMNNDDNEEKSDYTKFQDIFGNVIDDLLEEEDDD